MKSEKPLTERLEIYPAGRGRALVIALKKMPSKLKHKPKANWLTIVRIKSNPSDITLRAVINSDGVKRFYLFPEGRQLSYDERLDLAVSFLVSLSRSNRSYEALVPRELYPIVRHKKRRIQKWEKRNM